MRPSKKKIQLIRHYRNVKETKLGLDMNDTHWLLAYTNDDSLIGDI